MVTDCSRLHCNLTEFRYPGRYRYFVFKHTSTTLASNSATKPLRHSVYKRHSYFITWISCSFVHEMWSASRWLESASTTSRRDVRPAVESRNAHPCPPHTSHGERKPIFERCMRGHKVVPYHSSMPLFQSSLEFGLGGDGQRFKNCASFYSFSTLTNVYVMAFVHASAPIFAASLSHNLVDDTTKKKFTIVVILLFAGEQFHVVTFLYVTLKLWVSGFIVTDKFRSTTSTSNWVNALFLSLEKRKIPKPSRFASCNCNDFYFFNRSYQTWSWLR